MTDIALAILAVGLCFYNGYLLKNGDKVDILAGLISFFASITILIH